MKSVVRNAAIFTVFFGSYWMGALAVDNLLQRPAAAPQWESPSTQYSPIQGSPAQNSFASQRDAEHQTTPVSAENALAVD